MPGTGATRMACFGDLDRMAHQHYLAELAEERKASP
jgi:hypothetical protein